MKKTIALMTLLLMAAAVVCITIIFSSRGKILVIRGGTLIDGTGRSATENSAVIIRDGIISAVNPEREPSLPPFVRTIRADGKFIIPGLVDMHVHFSEESFCQLFLRYGVTTIRDMGNDLDFIIELREKIESGKAAGPDIIACGYLINDRKIPFGASEYTAVVKTPAQARRAVAVMARNKADWIKVYITLSQKLLRVVLTEAEIYGLPVAGHLRRVDAAKAARWGIKSLEHATGIAEALIPDKNFEDVPPFWTISPRIWPRAERARYPELIDLLIENGVAITANLTLYHSFCLTPDELQKKAPVDVMPEKYRTGWKNYARRKFPDLVRYHEEWIITRQKLEEFLLLFKERGGKVVAGTDTPWPYLIPGLSLHEEMELLVKAGFAPLEALLTATRYPAEVLGRWDEFGSIERGKRADLVILDADPLADIRNTQKIDTVIKAGRIIPSNRR